MRALKMKSAVTSYRKMMTTEGIITADAPTTTWEVAPKLSVDHSMVACCLKQIGKVKSLDKWVPHELTTNQKNHRFEVASLILCNNNEPFLNLIVMCDKKQIL